MSGQQLASFSPKGGWPAAWLAAGLFCLDGCARFEPRPIEPAKAAALLENRRLDNPQLEQFLIRNLPSHPGAWPAEAWDFQMLWLTALYYHPSLEVARAQWQLALAGGQTAAGRPNPTLNAIPGYDLNAASGLSPWIPAVTFDLPLETAGKRGYRMAQAQHLSEAARWNLTVAAWQVRTTLRASLIEVTAAEERTRLLRQQQSVQERIIQVLEQQLRAGAVSSSELTLVRIALDQIRLDLYSAQEQSADARVRLADAIGIPVQALNQIRIATNGLTLATAAAPLLSANVRHRALESRADILASLAEYAARQSALQLEIAKQYPDIHLGPGYQYDQGNHKVSLSLTAELPILNQNQGPIAEARARRTEAAARFDALQAKVLTEIDRALASYEVAQQNLATLENMAASQKQRSDQVAAQVRAGAGDQLDLLNAQIELGATQLLQLNGQMRLQQSFAALEGAVQSPIDSVGPEFIERSPRPGSLP